MKRFSEEFASTGFRPETIVPVYGLAESTLLVSGAPLERPWVRAFDEDELERGTAVSVPDDSPAARVLVSCGTSRTLDVAVVDPRTRARCRPGQVGEIWVAGDSVAVGYWQRPDLTREAFEATPVDGGDQGPYMRTGDLGFRTEDGLFVCGRIKDVVIVGGRNHYPHDIQRTAESAHPAIRPGCVAAFGVDADGVEQVVVAAELRREPGAAHGLGRGTGGSPLLPGQRRARRAGTDLRGPGLTCCPARQPRRAGEEAPEVSRRGVPEPSAGTVHRSVRSAASSPGRP